MVSAQDPFCWDGSSATGPLGAVEPGRPRRRAGLIGAVLVVAAAGAGAAVLLLSGGGTAGGGVTELPLAHAAALTEQAPGFKESISLDVTLGSQNVAVSGSGWFNLRPLDGSLTLTAGSATVNELLVPPDLYLQTPNAGGQWTQTYVGWRAQTPSTGSLAPSPTEELNMLKSVGSVTALGSATTDGVPTTHYRAVVDTARFATLLPTASRVAWLKAATSLGIGTLPIDAWVDAAGRVRVVGMNLSLQTAQGAASIVLSVNYSDFGPQSQVSAPPANEIVDAGSQLAS